MKRKSYAIASACIIMILLLSCEKESKYEITIRNESKLDLKDKPITIARTSLNNAPSQAYTLIQTLDGDTIPSQQDDLDGDGSWDELFFVIDLNAEEKKSLLLTFKDTKSSYAVRTNVRFGKRDSRSTPVYAKTSDTLYAHQIHAKLGYQPYQTDGPMWENDKVGFRHYFDGRNSKDLFGKKISDMSPDTVGINQKGSVVDNYHVMAPWGRDVLAVGNSVGIGGVNLMIGDSISRLGSVAGDTLTNVESSIFKIITKGPVRSIINFQYNNWKPFDNAYQVKETVAIWPGMYAFQNTVSVSGITGNESLLIGLVNSNTENALKEISVNDQWIVLLTHDKQTYDKQWWLGLAIILPKSLYAGYGEAPASGKFSNTFYGKLKIQNQTPVTYYSVGCWELSDERFADASYFERYAVNLAQQLSANVNVEVQNQ